MPWHWSPLALSVFPDFVIGSLSNKTAAQFRQTALQFTVFDGAQPGAGEERGVSVDDVVRVGLYVCQASKLVGEHRPCFGRLQGKGTLRDRMLREALAVEVSG